MIGAPGKLASAVFAIALTSALVAAPYRIGIAGLSPTLVALHALAQGADGRGNSGEGNSGSGNSEGSGNSGSGSGESSSVGTPAGGKGNTQGNTQGEGPAPGTGIEGGAAFGDDFGRRSNEHINETTGDRIEINGSDIDVLHQNGMTETITEGRYRMNDSMGRTIIERRATESDRARLRGLMG